MTHSIEKSGRETEVLRFIDSSGDVVRIGFGNDGIGIRTIPVTSPPESTIVRIEGEDLTALRDRLLAMPESAFPRPRREDIVGAVVRIKRDGAAGEAYRGLLATVVFNDGNSPDIYSLDFGDAAKVALPYGNGGQWHRRSFDVVVTKDDAAAKRERF